MTYSELRDEFFRRIESLEISGTAELNRKCSEILGEILSENVLKISDIAQSCEKILCEYYEYMNETNVRIQKELDEKNGLRIAVRKADFPEKRVKQIAKSLADPTVPPETIQRRAGSAVENVSRSFYNNFVRENAKFRSKAGIKCYIVRETDGNCCKWCSALAGRYVYSDEPNDVYRRHDNCTCTVTFENGRERQNVWSKEKWKVTPILKLPYKPLVLDKNQARAIERQNLRYKGLTIDRGSGIISTRNPDRMGEPYTEKIPRKQKTTIFKTYKLNGYDNIWSQTYTANAQAMSEYLDNLLLTGKYGTLDRVIIAKKEKLGGIASYSHAENALYISEELIDPKLFSKIVSPGYFPARSLDEVIAHELGGHKKHWEAAERFYQANQGKYSDLYSAKIAMESKLQDYIIRQVSSDRRYIADFISENARNGFESSVPWKRLNELIADVNVRQQQGTIQDEFLSQLVKEILEYDANTT